MDLYKETNGTLFCHKEYWFGTHETGEDYVHEIFLSYNSESPVEVIFKRPGSRFAHRLNGPAWFVYDRTGKLTHYRFYLNGNKIDEHLFNSMSLDEKISLSGLDMISL